MAGSFFHIWLAHRAWEQMHEAADPSLLPAFCAGAVAPDIGFFPGGPKHFSQRVHLERSGDFVRALCEEARCEKERAFAAGWALHVYTDLALHPWVEAWVDELLDAGQQPPHRDMWHMRLEWGIDCHLLARGDLSYLWRAPLEFPRCETGDALLVQIGRRFYDKDIDTPLVEKGEVSTAKLLRYIPLLLCLFGAVPGRQVRGFGFIGASLGKILGTGLQRWIYFKDVAALARPWPVDPLLLRRALDLGDTALQTYVAAWKEDFVHLGNPDLYRGKEQ